MRWTVLLLPLAACGAVSVTPKAAAPPGPSLLVGPQPPLTVPVQTTTTLRRPTKWTVTEQAMVECLDMFHVPGRVGAGSVDLSLLLTEVADGSLTALPQAVTRCALAQRLVARKYGAESPEAAAVTDLVNLLGKTKLAHDDGLLSDTSSLAFTALLTSYHKAFGALLPLISPLPSHA